jgi:hypothetical protein
LTHTTTYVIWCDMRARCQNPRSNRYGRYGARGIRVCERWELFDNFLADMGMRPAGLTLDRIDNDGNYSPENCRWASYVEQNNNTPRNRWYEFNGERRTLAQWARHLGINYFALRTRLDKLGWSVERAFQTGARHG